MTELGARLKEARVSKGYSLDDLQEITKIQKRYLVAIEEGNYSIMPGAFYIRAFIKQYAEAVGLDYDELAEQFKNEIPAHQQEEVAQSISKSPARRRFKTSSSRYMESLPKIIFALFIVVILVVIWFLNLQRPDPNEQVDTDDNKIEYAKKDVPEKKTEDKDDEEKDKDGQSDSDKEDGKNSDQEQADNEGTKQTISQGVVSGQNTTYEVTGTDTLKVRVEISGDSWIEVRDVNGKSLVEPRVYKLGEKIEYDATSNKYVKVRLGNSNNAKVFVNDEQIQLVQNRTTQNVIVELKDEAQVQNQE